MRISEIIDHYDLKSKKSLINFIESNPEQFSFYQMSRVIEYSNMKRNENSAYYTDENLLETVFERLPDFEDKETLKVLEPSVGAGNFIPFIVRKYRTKKLLVDVIDIDEDIIEILKVFISSLDLPPNIKIRFINSNFLEENLSFKYDLIVGNPPFEKINTRQIPKNYDSTSRNLSSYFLEKAIKHSYFVALIMPKNLLNTPEYRSTRVLLEKYNVSRIIDFGEKGFKGVLVETICIMINTLCAVDETIIESVTHNLRYVQKQEYIFSNSLPYWIIYRNEFFDDFYSNMIFDIFTVFRDRQITNKMLSEKGKIRVLKSRNLGDDGSVINNIPGYDAFIEEDEASKLSVANFLNVETFITPNMTYNTRVGIKPRGALVNGSLAILMLKPGYSFNCDDMIFVSTKEYRDFMKIARNYQTRSLNIDNNSVYFFGKRK